ncbi:hypothetical protein TWF718_009366 [Orbilia javanica]|uniref:Uncharacterized protein n=1 Tax=Orbilia javanica TaxID=47235 RepID=A0AAN8RH21_9PEZI
MKIIIFFAIAFAQALFTTASPIEGDQVILKDSPVASDGGEFHSNAWTIVGPLPSSEFFCGPKRPNNEQDRFSKDKVTAALQRANDIWFQIPMTVCKPPTNRSLIPYPKYYGASGGMTFRDCPKGGRNGGGDRYEFPLLTSGLYCNGTNQGSYRVIYQELWAGGTQPAVIRYCGVIYHSGSDFSKCNPRS